MLAKFGSMIPLMPRPIPLREAPGAAPPGAPVIDAEFRVVRRRRGVLGALRRALAALLWAALIGFLVPPLWMLMQRISTWLGDT